jgi:hypothetical protein
VNDDGLVEFQEVVAVEGADEGELYDRARAWFSKAYVSAESVLDLEDREAGRLVGKGVISLPGMGSYIVRHVLTVEVKDERYRYTLDKVTWSAGQGTAKTPPRPMTDKGNMMGKLTAKKDIRAWDELNTLIDSLKAAMQAANDDDEW